MKARKVRNEDVTRQVAFGQSLEIVGGLCKCATQILAEALVLDQQHAFPEGVDSPMLELVTGARDLHLLFEHGDTLALDAEHGEEFIPEALGLCALRAFAFPAFGEFVRAVADFVPA